MYRLLCDMCVNQNVLKITPKGMKNKRPGSQQLLQMATPHGIVKDVKSFRGIKKHLVFFSTCFHKRVTDCINRARLLQCPYCSLTRGNSAYTKEKHNNEKA